jgi:hypothetical protein
MSMKKNTVSKHITQCTEYTALGLENPTIHGWLVYHPNPVQFFPVRQYCWFSPGLLDDHILLIFTHGILFVDLKHQEVRSKDCTESCYGHWAGVRI